MIETSAPGKVVLAGEYAVLNGAPAVCMAVNRRATVALSATSENVHTVTAPGHVDDPHRFRVHGGEFEWLDPGGEFALLECVWRAARVTRESGLELRLDTSAFIDPGHRGKLGIGSSAALSVALAQALRSLEGDAHDALAVAHDAHFEFQRGLGSGVDVATSGAGGLALYRMKHRAAETLAMPAGLAYRVIWSGSSASTSGKLERLASRGGPSIHEALVRSSIHMAEAWQSGSARRVLRHYPEYIQVLQEFSEDRGLDVFGAGHAELAVLAADAGLVYKPCGAGGGDIGILLADDQDAADAFVESSLPERAKALDVHIEPRGVTAGGQGA